jgi:8-oxo-dGTP pyrophosphatase MutT (NUDIX family)
MTDILRQAGAIPFRRQPDGLRVLLITSRDTGRWVIPKGGVEPGQTPAQAAAQEAYEEAGVKGVMHPSPIGIYTYGKRLRAGLVKPAIVEVYPLEVEEQLARWPEHDQRRSEWMTVPRAAERVDEPGLRALLLRLAEIHDPQSVGG